MTSLRTKLSGKAHAIATLAAAGVAVVVLSLALSASAGPWGMASSSARNVIATVVHRTGR